MKWFFALLVVTLFLPSKVNAHASGIPIFKINNTFAFSYPVPYNLSSSEVELPQDLAPENYLVGQELDMQIDLSVFELSQEVLDKTRITWDFGNGDTAEGVTQTYAYTKPGSYILRIELLFTENQSSTELESLLIHILPFPEYQLPKAIIQVNNEIVQSPPNNKIAVPLTKTVSLDASQSTGQSRVTSLTWQVEETSSTNPKITHRFSDIEIQYPVLRIQTADGFFSDTYTIVTNKPQQKSNVFILIVTGIIAVLLTGLIVFIHQNHKQLPNRKILENSDTTPE